MSSATCHPFCSSPYVWMSQDLSHLSVNYPLIQKELQLSIKELWIWHDQLCNKNLSCHDSAILLILPFSLDILEIRLLSLEQYIDYTKSQKIITWWCHQMETFSPLLALCVGNSPVTGEFPSWKPVTWSFDAFFDMRLNKQLSNQSICQWFQMQLYSL